MIPKAQLPDPHNAILWLNVDGHERQRGSTNQMIFNIPQLIAHVSDIMTLVCSLEILILLVIEFLQERGDVILTGTPSGVGQVLGGQTINAGLDSSSGESLLQIEFPCVERVDAKL